MRSRSLTSSLLLLLMPAGCTSSVDSTPASFDARDINTTARWAAQLTSELNSIPPNSNDIARNSEIQSQLESAMEEVSGIVGKKISWRMQCGVSENVITIMPNQFGADGKTLIHDGNRIALMVLDDRPTKTEHGMPTRDSDPEYWFFQLDVPEQISSHIAATLPENVLVKGEISNIEIDRFRDREIEPTLRSDDDEWYLLYIYLTDVTLQPDGNG